MRFKQIVGRFTSGVAVVTTNLDGVDKGTTVSAVTSVSAEPPTLLVCLNAASETGQAISRAGRYVVNILSDRQVHIARRFAAKSPHKFDTLPIERTVGRLPYLPDSLACFECTVTEEVVAGTHSIFIGGVDRLWCDEWGDPLTYYRGKFGQFSEI